MSIEPEYYEEETDEVDLEMQENEPEVVENRKHLFFNNSKNIGFKYWLHDPVGIFNSFFVPVGMKVKCLIFR